MDPLAAGRANAHYLLGRIEQKRRKLAAAHEHFLAGAYAGIDGRDGYLDAAKEAAFDFALGLGTERDLERSRELVAQSRELSKRLGTSQVQNMVQAKQLDEFATADAEEFVAGAGDVLGDQTEFEIFRKLIDKKSKSRDPAAARQWLERIAGDGKVWAMTELALLFGGKELGNPDPVSAFTWWQRAGGDSPPKSLVAAGNLAICFQNGYGTTRDTAKAAALFKAHKNEAFLCYLGSIGAAPKEPLSGDDTVKLLEKWAKRKKDSHAQYLLGLLYQEGVGVPKDLKIAIDWLGKAAKAKHAGALFALGSISESNQLWVKANLLKIPRSAIEYYKEADGLGNADAAAACGFCYQQGVGVARDLGKAESYYRHCLKLEPGYARAHNNIGAIYEERLHEARTSGKGDVASLLQVMLQEYRAAASAGFAKAKLNLGNIYLSGELVPQDCDKAYGFFTDAAAGGMTEAHYKLGLMHENGQGVPVTFTEAAYHYRLAALDRSWPAAERLIDFYLTGKGVARDPVMAEHWMRATADMGNQPVLPELANLLITRGDNPAAFALFKKMAAMNDSYISGCGFEGLSECYRKGLGVEADSALADGYHALAIRQGNAEALTDVANAYLAENQTEKGVEAMAMAAKGSPAASYYLGQMYFFGTNVEQDRVKSLNLMRDSARMRNPKAMYFLAAATFNREPDAPALDEAIRFATMAENMGLPEAPSLREKLERRRDGAEEDTEQVARPRSG